MAVYHKGSYEDFEPLCQWQRGQARDILEVHLQGFKKENLRVQLHNVGILTISGEKREDEEAKISRFRKQIKVAKECTADQIRAKFANGILYITLGQVSNQSSVHDHDRCQKSSQGRAENNGAAVCGAVSIRQTTSCLRDGVLRIDISTKMDVSIPVLIAVGIAVGGFLIWKCASIPDPIVY